MLVDEEITITMDGERIHLRPSLRAAARLERRHGGFPAIMRGLEEGSITIVADLIGECAITSTRAADWLVKPGLSWRIAPLIPALIDLVVDLMGFDPEDEHDQVDGDQDHDERVTFAEVHARLYRLATGWLGWTPAETWAASPREIRQAYEGRLELLRAVFGSGSDQGSTKSSASLDDKFAALITRNATLPNATSV